MKRTFKSSIGAAAMVTVALALLAGCESYLGGDVNKNPSQVSEEVVPLSALLPTTIVSTADAHYWLSLTNARWAQQTADVGAGLIDSQDPSETSTAWETIYLSSLQTASRMVKLADQRQSPAYSGIGKVLQAMNLGLATDQWEAIPWTQGLKGSGNLTPDYDQQQTIYTEIQRLLDEAIVQLQRPIAESVFKPGAEDLIYAGNLSRWLKLANTLKARYALHLSNKGSVAAGAAALQALKGGIASNADDFALIYNTRNFNPWNTGVALANNTGNLSLLWSDYTVKSMNDDPRLVLIAQPIKATTPATASQLVGAVNGAGTVSGNNANLTEFTFYATTTAPILMTTYSEHKFLEAEAIFLQSGGSTTSVGATDDARNAVVAGVRANMAKMGVADTAITRYTNRIPAAKDLRLQDIMSEKWKSMLLHPEAWVDMRRYNQDPNVFKGLVYPQNGNSDAAGKWVQRANYVSSERARNGTNVQKYVKFFTAPMWRDSK